MNKDARNQMTKNESSQTTPARNSQISFLQANMTEDHSINLHWNMQKSELEMLSTYFESKVDNLSFVLRIFDVSSLGEAYEVSMPLRENSWTIKGLKCNHSYFAELGIKLSNETFFPLLRSATLPILSKNRNEKDLLPFKKIKNEKMSWQENVSTYTFYEDVRKEETRGRGQNEIR